MLHFARTLDDKMATQPEFCQQEVKLKPYLLSEQILKALTALKLA